MVNSVQANRPQEQTETGEEDISEITRVGLADLKKTRAGQIARGGEILYTGGGEGQRARSCDVYRLSLIIV